MMVPPWRNEQLIARFNRTDRARGFEITRVALLEATILDITKLLFDGGQSDEETNPSLLTMTRPFLIANRKEKYAELLKILEHDCSNWHRFISPEERKNEPEWVIQAMEQMDEEDVEAAKLDFWNSADTVAADWPKLIEAGEKFRPIRNKWIAHFEVEYDESKKEYRVEDMVSFKDVLATIDKVVPIITDNVEHLAALFANLSIGRDETIARAMKQAAVFWELPSNTQD